MNNPMLRRLRRSQPVAPAKAPEPANVKPFALQLLESGHITQQITSPLFVTIPKEIRDLIFEYALAAYPDPNRPYSNKENYARPGVSGRPRIAVELLLSCKAVYVECYQLPITLNPIIIYHDFTSHVPPHAQRGVRNLRQLAVWQLAALHMVDISLQQYHLERRAIAEAASQVEAGKRFNQSQTAINFRNNLSVAEESHASSAPTKDPASAIPAPPNSTPSQPQRLSGLEMPSEDYNILRPISRLTLRLGRTEWWTWEDHPNSISQLGIDPAHGDGTVEGRCTNELMLTEAEKRRNGDQSNWVNDGCWGAQVAEFKGLRELECVFETFKLKEKQLDTVLECAKTWVFPMDDGYELRWDGKIDRDEWTGVDDYGYEASNTWLRERNANIDSMGERTEDEDKAAAEARKRFEDENPLPDHRLFVVRAIRFTRRKCGSLP